MFTTMMESLEGRQMFSVAPPESGTLATADVAVDTTAPTVDAASKSSPTLLAFCCTGKHIVTGTIVAR
jgi:hypothetical protein